MSDYIHTHRFTLATTKKEFEPITIPEDNHTNLYEMVEYAILYCQCGEAMKRRLDDRDEQ